MGWVGRTVSATFGAAGAAVAVVMGAGQRWFDRPTSRMDRKRGRRRIVVPGSLTLSLSGGF
jgi:hypothetical protein